MRLAYVQLGDGFPSLEAQVLRVMALRPDDYTIEESPTDAARRRVSERLDALGPGDRVCVSSLDMFHGPARDLTTLISKLLSRDVVVETFDETGEVVEIGATRAERLLMGWLSQIFAETEKSAPRRGASANHETLSDEDVAEIRRLSRAGLSPRRIGLIFRRSPKCIEGLLLAHPDEVGELPRRIRSQR